jgi:hypothetical protein
MQEAMLACIDITKPQFRISLANLAAQKNPNDVAMRDGNLCYQQKRQTLGIQATNKKSKYETNMDAFLWK